MHPLPSAPTSDIPSTDSPRLLCVVGARPNFVKIAPIMAALAEAEEPISARLIHTGQHYDERMKALFFSQLGIRQPDIDLEVGSGSHAVQTAEVMRRFEKVALDHPGVPVLVVGDVNSTLACALVASKLGTPVIHVEAGLRSRDRAMPEEINRVLTDQLSDLLFTTERSARDNLIREGIEPERIHFVGNVMVDTLLHNIERASDPGAVLATHGLDARYRERIADGYGVLTLHRPANVDDERVLRDLLQAVVKLSERLPILFPIHPRTLTKIRAFGLVSLLEYPGLIPLEPLGYLDMLGIVRHARAVLTDSGGLQEETSALGVPCLTLRENTERPVTLTGGSNTLVGSDPQRLLEEAEWILAGGRRKMAVPELWDGQAARRIVEVLRGWLG